MQGVFFAIIAIGRGSEWPPQCNTSGTRSRCDCVVTPDVPQSEIAATNFVSRQSFGRTIGRKNGEKLGELSLGIFVLYMLCRMTPKISPQIPPNLSLRVNLVATIPKFQLREVLDLGGPNRVGLEGGQAVPNQSP